MPIDLKILLKTKAFNGWRLFWLTSIPMSIVMLTATMGTDISTGPGVSNMIQFPVRWAVPLIFLVVAASSVQILFPGPFPRWWLRNRKYIGMCFAVAMAWQGVFIFIMSNFFREYYFADVYYENPQLIDYVYFWSGFLAFALRIAAWGKQRQQAAKRNAPHSSTPRLFKIMGGTMIAFGLFVAASGLYWQKPVTAF